VPLIKRSRCVNGPDIWPDSVHSTVFICIAKSTKIAALARTSLSSSPQPNKGLCVLLEPILSFSIRFMALARPTNSAAYTRTDFISFALD
jgi:hypothetical protein